MKTFAALAVSGALLSVAAFADDAKVEITSFNYINNAGRAAEICGKVIGHDAGAMVRVTVDENSSAPGMYNVLVGKDGLFCTVVASYRGTASASLEVGGHTLRSETVTAKTLRLL